MSAAETILYPVIFKVPAALSPENRRPLEMRREQTKFLSHLARHALRHACALSGLCLAEFPKAGNGAPIPVNGVYWSLSHKPEVAGGVAAKQPVGMDLETIRAVRSGLFSKVANAAEWTLFPDGQNQMTFFRVWTAKEAVIKAEGIGFAGISRCRVQAVTGDAAMTLTFDQTRWRVWHHRFGDHMAAVTVPPGFTVHWRILDPAPELLSRV